MVINVYASGTREQIMDAAAEKKPSARAEYIGEEAYALAVYRSQNEAGLSFGETGAALLPIRLMKVLAEERGCSTENVCNLRRRGLDKIWAVTGDDNKEFARLMPQNMRHIF